MARNQPSSKIAHLLSWLAAALAVATLLWFCLASGRGSGADDTPHADQIRVIVGRDPATGWHPIAPSPFPVHSSASVQAAIADLTRDYPMLTNAALDCTRDPCTLTAVVMPVDGQAALNKRQEMLLGGLQAHLAARGYLMAMPFQIDEVDDNTFRLRASVSR